MITKIAEIMTEENDWGTENVEIEKVEPKSVFEKALLLNKTSVPLWEAYLKFCVLHNEETTN